MTNINEYITSGIVQSYVLGLATAEECQELEAMMLINEPVRTAVDAFSIELEQYALANATPPATTSKSFILASIDFIERMQNGEKPSFPPLLSEGVRVSDFAEWLNRPDMVLPEDADDIHAKIIGYVPGITTAIVWIKEMTPAEVHDKEHEKFLIVEGTCTVTIGQQSYELKPGDYMVIPLFENHYVNVTSEMPCKVILQRVAA